MIQVITMWHIQTVCRDKLDWQPVHDGIELSGIESLVFDVPHSSHNTSFRDNNELHWQLTTKEHIRLKQKQTWTLAVAKTDIKLQNLGLIAFYDIS